VRETFSGIEKGHITNAHVVEMDAGYIGFADGTFDMTLCGFIAWDYCYDFFRDEFTAHDIRIDEISRVLRGGGRLGISSWERQENIEWMESIYTRYFPEIVSDARVDHLPRPLVYSKETPGGYERILREGGFDDIEIIQESADFISPNEETWWEQICRVGWQRYLNKIEERNAKELDEFKEAVFEELQDMKDTDGIHFKKHVFFIFGRKV
jgi:SAM-dependent methyltransferase